MHCNASYGPTFGGNHDLYICNNSNIQASSYSKIGHTYDNLEITEDILGTNKLIEEIEVFTVVK